MNWASKEETEALIGKVFGRLTIKEIYYKQDTDKKRRYAMCQCSCGKEKELRLQNILAKTGTVSCGCLVKELTYKTGKKWGGVLVYKNGHSLHPLHATWEAMIGRCYNPRFTGYKYYGGRGIDVCDSWRTDFMQFVKDMGERPEGMTLDRIDFNKGYSPENCRWATKLQQDINRRNTLYREWNGKKTSLIEISRELNVPIGILGGWHKRGWTNEEIKAKHRPRKSRKGMKYKSYKKRKKKGEQ